MIKLNVTAINVVAPIEPIKPLPGYVLPEPLPGIAPIDPLPGYVISDPIVY